MRAEWRPNAQALTALRPRLEPSLEEFDRIRIVLSGKLGKIAVSYQRGVRVRVPDERTHETADGASG